MVQYKEGSLLPPKTKKNQTRRFQYKIGGVVINGSESLRSYLRSLGPGLYTVLRVNIGPNASRALPQEVQYIVTVTEILCYICEDTLARITRVKRFRVRGYPAPREFEHVVCGDEKTCKDVMCRVFQKWNKRSIPLVRPKYAACAVEGCERVARAGHPCPMHGGMDLDKGTGDDSFATRYTQEPRDWRWNMARWLVDAKKKYWFDDEASAYAPDEVLDYLKACYRADRSVGWDLEIPDTRTDDDAVRNFVKNLPNPDVAREFGDPDDDILDPEVAKREREDAEVLKYERDEQLSERAIREAEEKALEEIYAWMKANEELLKQPIKGLEDLR